jgi:hypothetical protein
LRSYDLAFAIRPFAHAEDDGLYAEALAWRQRPAMGMLWGADPTWDGTPAPELLELAEGPVRLHALKPAEDGNGAVLRLFNTSSQAQTARVRGKLAAGLVPCDLLEQPDVLPACTAGADGWTILPLPPLGLRSFRCIPVES